MFFSSFRQFNKIDISVYQYMNVIQEKKEDIQKYH